MDQQNKNIFLIDYIKAFAIILVIITHYNFTQVQRFNILFPFVINMAVPFFMLISGYNYANSFLKNNIIAISKMYNFKLILKKVLKLSIPLLIIFLIQYFCYPVKTHNHSFLTGFINGGYGKGSYYYPVMLQLIFLFPIIYIIIKKLKVKGLFLIILSEIIYMLLCVKFGIPKPTFRILFFRYISIVSFGTYFSIFNPKISNFWLQLMYFWGVIYILSVQYIGKISFYPYISSYWGKLSGIYIALYVFPIFYLLFNYFKDYKIDNAFGRILSYIGKASWHIMLIQMFYYFAFDKYLKPISFPIHLSINILVCLILGSIYYMIDTKFISKNILKLLKLK